MDRKNVKPKFTFWIIFYCTQHFLLNGKLDNERFLQWWKAKQLIVFHAYTLIQNFLIENNEIIASLRIMFHIFLILKYLIMSSYLIWLQPCNNQDHGIFRDGTKEISETQHEQYMRTLSQDLNRQGAVVLEGRTVGKRLSLQHIFPITNINFCKPINALCCVFLVNSWSGGANREDNKYQLFNLLRLGLLVCPR